MKRNLREVSKPSIGRSRPGQIPCSPEEARNKTQPNAQNIAASLTRCLRSPSAKAAAAWRQQFKVLESLAEELVPRALLDATVSKLEISIAEIERLRSNCASHNKAGSCDAQNAVKGMVSKREFEAVAAQLEESRSEIVRLKSCIDDVLPHLQIMAAKDFAESSVQEREVCNGALSDQDRMIPSEAEWPKNLDLSSNGLTNIISEINRLKKFLDSIGPESRLDDIEYDLELHRTEVSRLHKCLNLKIQEKQIALESVQDQTEISIILGEIDELGKLGNLLELLSGTEVTARRSLGVAGGVASDVANLERILGQLIPKSEYFNFEDELLQKKAEKHRFDLAVDDIVQQLDFIPKDKCIIECNSALKGEIEDKEITRNEPESRNPWTITKPLAATANFQDGHTFFHKEVERTIQSEDFANRSSQGGSNSNMLAFMHEEILLDSSSSCNPRAELSIQEEKISDMQRVVEEFKQFFLRNVSNSGCAAQLDWEIANFEKAVHANAKAQVRSLQLQLDNSRMEVTSLQKCFGRVTAEVARLESLIEGLSRTGSPSQSQDDEGERLPIREGMTMMLANENFRPDMFNPQKDVEHLCKDLFDTVSQDDINKITGEVARLHILMDGMVDAVQDKLDHSKLEIDRLQSCVEGMVPIEQLESWMNNPSALEKVVLEHSARRLRTRQNRSKEKTGTESEFYQDRPEARPAQQREQEFQMDLTHPVSQTCVFSEKMPAERAILNDLVLTGKADDDLTDCVIEDYKRKLDDMASKMDTMVARTELDDLQARVISLKTESELLKLLMAEMIPKDDLQDAHTLIGKLQEQMLDLVDRQELKNAEQTIINSSREINHLRVAIDAMDLEQKCNDIQMQIFSKEHEMLRGQVNCNCVFLKEANALLSSEILALERLLEGITQDIKSDDLTFTMKSLMEEIDCLKSDLTGTTCKHESDTSNVSLSALKENFCQVKTLIKDMVPRADLTDARAHISDLKEQIRLMISQCDVEEIVQKVSSELLEAQQTVRILREEKARLLVHLRQIIPKFEQYAAVEALMMKCTILQNDIEIAVQLARRVEEDLLGLSVSTTNRLQEVDASCERQERSFERAILSIDDTELHHQNRKPLCQPMIVEDDVGNLAPMLPISELQGDDRNLNICRKEEKIELRALLSVHLKEWADNLLMLGESCRCERRRITAELQRTQCLANDMEIATSQINESMESCRIQNETLQAQIEQMVPASEHAEAQAQVLQLKADLKQARDQLAGMVSKSKLDQEKAHVAELEAILSGMVPKALLDASQVELERCRGELKVSQSQVGQTLHEAWMRLSDQLREWENTLRLLGEFTRVDLARMISEVKRLEDLSSDTLAAKSRLDAILQDSQVRQIVRESERALAQARVLKMTEELRQVTDRAAEMVPKEELEKEKSRRTELEATLACMVPRVELDYLHAELERFKQKHEIFQERFGGELEAVQERFRIQLTEWEGTLRGLGESFRMERARLIGKLEVLDNLTGETCTVKSQLDATLEGCKSDNARLQARMEQMVSATELMSAQAQVLDLTEELEKARDQAAKMVSRDDLEHQKLRIAELEATLTDMVPAAELDYTQRDLVHCKAELQVLQERVGRMIDRTKVEAANAQMSIRLKEWANAVLLLGESSRSERARMMAELEKMKDLANEVQLSTSQIKEVQARMKQMVLASEQAAAQAQILELAEELKQARDQLTGMVSKGELEQQNSRAAELEAMLSGMVSKILLDASQQELERSRGDLQASEEQKERELEAIRTLQARMEQMVSASELEVAQERVSSLTEELRLATDMAANMVARNELEREKLQNAELEVKLTRMVPSAELDASQRLLEQCKGELEVLQERVGQMIDRTELRTQVEAMRAGLKGWADTFLLLRDSSRREGARVMAELERMQGRANELELATSQIHDTMQSEIVALQAQVGQMVLASVLETAQAQVLELTEELRRSRDQAADMVSKSELEQQKSSIAQLEATLNGMVPKTLLDAAQLELELCRGDLQGAQERVAQELETTRVLQAQIGQMVSAREFEVAQGRISILTEELRLASDKATRMIPKDEMEQGQQRIAELEAKLTLMVPAVELGGSRRVLEQCQRELQLAQERVGQMIDRTVLHSELKAMQAQLSTRLKEWTNTLLLLRDSSRAERARAMVELERLQGLANEMQLAMSEVNESIENCQSQNATLQAQIEQIVSEHAATQAHVLELAEELKQARDQLTGMVSKNDLDQEKSRSGELEARLSGMVPKALLSASQQELDQCQRDLQAAAEQIRRELEAASTMQARMEQMVSASELEVAQGRVSTLTEELRLATELAADMVAKNELEKIRNAELDARLTQMVPGAELDASQRLLEQCKAELEVLQERVGQMIDRTVLHTELEAMRTEQSMRLKECANALLLLGDSSRQEKERIMAELERLQGLANETEVIRSQINEGMANCQSQNASLQAQIEQIVSEHAAAQAHVLELAEELKQARDQLTGMVSKNDLDQEKSRAGELEARLSGMVPKALLSASQQELDWCRGDLQAAAERVERGLEATCTMQARMEQMVSASELEVAQGRVSTLTEELRLATELAADMVAKNELEKIRNAELDARLTQMVPGAELDASQRLLEQCKAELEVLQERVGQMIDRTVLHTELEAMRTEQSMRLKECANALLLLGDSSRQEKERIMAELERIQGLANETEVFRSQINESMAKCQSQNARLQAQVEQMVLAGEHAAAQGQILELMEELRQARDQLAGMVSKSELDQEKSRAAELEATLTGMVPKALLDTSQLELELCRGDLQALRELAEQDEDAARMQLRKWVRGWADNLRLLGESSRGERGRLVAELVNLDQLTSEALVAKSRLDMTLKNDHMMQMGRLTELAVAQAQVLGVTEELRQVSLMVCKDGQEQEKTHRAELEAMLDCRVPRSDLDHLRAELEQCREELQISQERVQQMIDSTRIESDELEEAQAQLSQNVDQCEHALVVLSTNSRGQRACLVAELARLKDMMLLAKSELDEAMEKCQLEGATLQIQMVQDLSAVLPRELVNQETNQTVGMALTVELDSEVAASKLMLNTASKLHHDAGSDSINDAGSRMCRFECTKEDSKVVKSCQTESRTRFKQVERSSGGAQHEEAVEESSSNLKEHNDAQVHSNATLLEEQYLTQQVKSLMVPRDELESAQLLIMHLRTDLERLQSEQNWMVPKEELDSLAAMRSETCNGSSNLFQKQRARLLSENSKLHRSLQDVVVKEELDNANQAVEQNINELQLLGQREGKITQDLAVAESKIRNLSQELDNAKENMKHMVPKSTIQELESDVERLERVMQHMAPKVDLEIVKQQNDRLLQELSHVKNDSRKNDLLKAELALSELRLSTVSKELAEAKRAIIETMSMDEMDRVSSEVARALRDIVDDLVPKAELQAAEETIRCYRQQVERLHGQIDNMVPKSQLASLQSNLAPSASIAEGNGEESPVHRSSRERLTPSSRERSTAPAENLTAEMKGAPHRPAAMASDDLLEKSVLVQSSIACKADVLVIELGVLRDCVSHLYDDFSFSCAAAQSQQMQLRTVLHSVHCELRAKQEECDRLHQGFAGLSSQLASRNTDGKLWSF